MVLSLTIGVRCAPSSAVQFLAGGGVAALVAALRTHTKESAIQEAASKALWGLMFCPDR